MYDLIKEIRELKEIIINNNNKTTERLIRTESKITAANNANLISTVKNDESNYKQQIHLTYINNKCVIQLNHQDLRISDLIHFISENNVYGNIEVYVGDKLLCQITL